jgi:hypothetical protein
MKVRNPFFTVSFLASLLIVLAASGQAQDLTGQWKGNDGGTYLLRQVGTTLWWLGQSGDGGRSWKHVFNGTIQGDLVSGRWADLPGGGSTNSGEFRLRIVSGTKLQIEGSGGAFGCTEWERTDSPKPPGPGTGQPKPEGKTNPPKPPRVPKLNGTWSIHMGEYIGTVTIKQDGTKIEASAVLVNSTLSRTRRWIGTIEGSKVTGTFEDTNTGGYDDKGKFTWTISPDGKTIKGQIVGKYTWSETLSRK